MRELWLLGKLGRSEGPLARQFRLERGLGGNLEFDPNLALPPVSGGGSRNGIFSRTVSHSLGAVCPVTLFASAGQRTNSKREHQSLSRVAPCYIPPPRPRAARAEESDHCSFERHQRKQAAHADAGAQARRPARLRSLPARTLRSAFK